MKKKQTKIMWQLLQLLGGIVLIVIGAIGIVTPLIPGILLILAGISLILHITIRKAWSVFKDRVLP